MSTKTPTVTTTASNPVSPNALNLDDYTSDPAALEVLAAQLKLQASYCAQQAGYARLKAKAMRARLNGRVGDAVRHERLLDEVYESLPEVLRW